MAFGKKFDKNKNKDKRKQQNPLFKRKKFCRFTVADGGNAGRILVGFAAIAFVRGDGDKRRCRYGQCSNGKPDLFAVHHLPRKYLYTSQIV